MINQSTIDFLKAMANVAIVGIVVFAALIGLHYVKRLYEYITSPKEEKREKPKEETKIKM